MSKSPKQMPHCLKRAETNSVQSPFNDGLYHVHAYTVAVLHESGTRTTISWSVTVYSKKLSSQCNLTAQIEQALDKNIQVYECNEKLPNT